MNIIKISILERAGTDIVYVYTDLPTTFPAWDDGNLVMQFETAKGHGEKYVRENFNIEPEFVLSYFNKD